MHANPPYIAPIFEIVDILMDGFQMPEKFRLQLSSCNYLKILTRKI